MPVGTPYSIAPECLSGAYTVQCDLWSVGVLTFMMLAGTPPFAGRCACLDGGALAILSSEKSDK